MSQSSSPFQVARRNERAAAQEQVDGDRSCAWIAAGERCHFPGSISHSTLGWGPWWCNQHIGCSDPVQGAQIVQASRGFRVGDPIVAQPRDPIESTCELVQEEPGSGG